MPRVHFNIRENIREVTWRELALVYGIYVLIEEGFTDEMKSWVQVLVSGERYSPQGIVTRWDKAPVDGKMVYAVVMSHPDIFCKSEGRIRLLI